MKEIDREQFAADVAEGMTVTALRKKYGLQHSEAKQLKAEIEGEESPEPAAEVDNENYDITTTVPTGRIGDLLRGLDFEEICAAIAEIHPSNQAAILEKAMQQRMNRLLQPKDVSTSSIELVPVAS